MRRIRAYLLTHTRAHIVSFSIFLVVEYKIVNRILNLFESSSFCVKTKQNVEFGVGVFVREFCMPFSANE